jgi:uracil-DNA glycosylase family protein
LHANEESFVVTAKHSDALGHREGPARGHGKEHLDDLRRSAATCRACSLWEAATQTVFGEGNANAAVMFVGEQPGDQEDRAGHPFVGPAGQLLDRALQDAGIERAECYVTNVVKHFKWVLRGTRRLHKTPLQREVQACSRWITQEIATVAPQIIVCLGATAARAMLGREFRVTQQRGHLYETSRLPPVLATVHPSSILRTQTSAEREAAYAAFVADLKQVRSRMKNV